MPPFSQPVSIAQYSTGSTPPPQKRVVCCAFSPHSESLGARWPILPNDRSQLSGSKPAGLQNPNFGTGVDAFSGQNKREQESTPSESASSKECKLKSKSIKTFLWW